MAKNKTIVLSDPDNTMKTETQQPNVAPNQGSESSTESSTSATGVGEANPVATTTSAASNADQNVATQSDAGQDATVITLENFVGTDFEEFETAEPQFETLQTLTTNQLMEM